MFATWGSWVARFRWPVLIVALAAVIGAGTWGMGVFGQLSEGGYNDPSSESTQAADTVQRALGARGGDVVIIYTPERGTIDDAALAERVRIRLSTLPAGAVRTTTSYWQDKAPQYAAADRSSAVAVLTLAGADDAAKLESFREIGDQLGVEGASAQVAGAAALGDASASRSTKDLGVAEAISLPIVLILLLFIFGSLVAAALPVLVGGAAVLGSLGILHAIALGHDVNSFAVNVASLLGLGMAIDYGLFMVGRFREEQAFGRTPAEAVTRAVATAGRTVLFSATLLMIALAGLLLFPQGFLKSLAYGGLAAVGLAAVLSLTLLPAVLAALGPRVDKLPVRLPRRRTARPAGTGWARLADLVLRRPLLVAIPIIAGLLVLAAPISGVQFGENDERVLPAGEPARTAVETLKADYPALSSTGIQVVLRGTQGAPPSTAAGRTFAAALARVPGIAAVTPGGTGGDVLLLTATLPGKDPFTPAARAAVDDIRALPAPPDTQLLVGGATARNVDSLAATAGRLPLMICLLVGATLVLMFLAFGSILLPIKAVLVSALSLSATFGILVWIFQDGHGAGLLHVTPAPLEVGIVVLMAAVVFGLSTDYEVFLLSRMVEARTRGASTAESVTTGLARTGRVISAAAVLLIVVTGAFALSSITTMRFVGVGMIIALLLDATVVRMLLVPAILGLMGDAAWWSPGPLRRLQERAGLAEYAGEELFPTISVGRHAAPDNAVPGTSVVAYTGAPKPPRHASERGPIPAPTSPAPARSAPTSPAPARSAPTSPAPTSPAPARSAPTSPAPTSPAPARPAPASPGPALPMPAGPAPEVALPSAPAPVPVPDRPTSPWITPRVISASAPVSPPELPPGPGPALALPAGPAAPETAADDVPDESGEDLAPLAGAGERPAPVAVPVPPGAEETADISALTGPAPGTNTPAADAESSSSATGDPTADTAASSASAAAAASPGAAPASSDDGEDESGDGDGDGDGGESGDGRTVDLASRMKTQEPDADPGPAPDTTAVLELLPTVDLSAHLQQASDQPDKRD